MNELSTQYLDKKQTYQKYPFITPNMLKNLLFKDVGGFRSKVAIKIGRRIFLDEVALLRFLAESREARRDSSDSKSDKKIGEAGRCSV